MFSWFWLFLLLLCYKYPLVWVSSSHCQRPWFWSTSVRCNYCGWKMMHESKMAHKVLLSLSGAILWYRTYQYGITGTTTTWWDETASAQELLSIDYLVVVNGVVDISRSSICHKLCNLRAFMVVSVFCCFNVCIYIYYRSWVIICSDGKSFWNKYCCCNYFDWGDSSSCCDSKIFPTTKCKSWDFGKFKI